MVLNLGKKTQIEDEDEFFSLEKSLLKKVKENRKNSMFGGIIKTTSATKYFNQDLFRLNKKLVDAPYYCLYNGDGTVNDLSFIYFLGKDTPEFKRMCEILEKIEISIYQYLNIPRPD